MTFGSFRRLMMRHVIKKANTTKERSVSPERVAKVIARAGICSRREAERRIAEGRVKIDGKVLSSPAVNVSPTNKILIDDNPLPPPAPYRLWRYYKPLGLLTTAKDPQGRTTIFEKLPRNLPRLITVGRLDLNSEGLLLMTNDGDLARKLELPSTGWRRRYRARVHGRVNPSILEDLKGGIKIDGVSFGPIEATLDRQKSSNAWITLALTEGKNREIRKIMSHLGWPVTRLIRISYGPFQLGNMIKGTIVEVNKKVLREQIGTEFR